MSDIPVGITIARTPTPLVTRSDGTTALTLVGYTEPAMQARIRYAPTSIHTHGEVALGWSWQQTLIAFDVATRGAASEAAARTAHADLLAAITQFPAYEVTVEVADAAPETWLCDPGSISPASPRDYPDLRDHDPVWRVSIPCYPVRSS